jgi:hypothetical protein
VQRGVFPLVRWFARVHERTGNKLVKRVHGALFELSFDLGLFTLGQMERRLERGGLLDRRHGG